MNTVSPQITKAIITHTDAYNSDNTQKYFIDIGYDYVETYNKNKNYCKQPFYHTFGADEERRYKWIDYYVLSTKEFDDIAHKNEHTEDGEVGLESYHHYVAAEEILSQSTIDHYKHHCRCYNCSLYCFDIFTRRIHPVAAGCFLSDKPSPLTLKKTRDEIKAVNERWQSYMNISPGLKYGY